MLDMYNSIPGMSDPIDIECIDNLEQYCIYFETKNEHPLALNTATLAVYPIYFLALDRSMLFDICHVDESTLKSAISNCPAIDTTQKVRSDPYNNLVIWQAHKILTSKLSSKDKDRGLLALFKMLNYKFFTSVVNHNFPHGANKAVMEATIRGLSNKFDIIQLGTWKRVIEERSKDIFASSSIHYKSLLNFTDDEKNLYVITDTQSRIRRKIVLVQQEYYNNYNNDEGIENYSNIGTDKDGEKIIAAASNVFDVMIAGLQSQIQSPGRFIDNELVETLCGMFTYVKPEVFKRVLIIFTEKAAMQASTNELDTTGRDSNDNVLYTGCNLLIKEMIQKTYRYCILHKVDPTNKILILKQSKNLYASSRITDEDILTIKRSVVAFVLGCDQSKRDATNASISIAFILYVIIRTFEYL